MKVEVSRFINTTTRKLADIEYKGKKAYLHARRETTYEVILVDNNKDETLMLARTVSTFEKDARKKAFALLGLIESGIVIEESDIPTLGIESIDTTIEEVKQNIKNFISNRREKKRHE